jgi:aminocarboxymuconate-semialdehyde decarboxylase
VIVDIHAHVIVPELLRGGPAGGWGPAVTWPGGAQVVEFGGRRITSAVREFVHVEGILEAQAAAGVDVVLLCPWVNLLGYDLEAETARRLCGVQNAALAGLVRRYPDRVRALGTVPLQEPQLAARELEAVTRELGLAGVEVAASVRGAYLGDDAFRSFWEAAEDLGALVFVHPTTRGLGVAALGDYYLWNSVGNPLETTIAAAHMVMAGVMERHPGLRVLLAHGGGALPALRGRLERAHAVQSEARSRLKESPRDSVRRFYFDTLTHDVDALRGLITAAGAERVLLGSDYPFDMGLERPDVHVRAMRLPPAEEAAVLGGNAAHLLGLSTGANGGRA